MEKLLHEYSKNKFISFFMHSKTVALNPCTSYLPKLHSRSRCFLCEQKIDLISSTNLGTLRNSCIFIYTEQRHLFSEMEVTPQWSPSNAVQRQSQVYFIGTFYECSYVEQMKISRKQLESLDKRGRSTVVKKTARYISYSFLKTNFRNKK